MILLLTQECVLDFLVFVLLSLTTKTFKTESLKSKKVFYYYERNVKMILHCFSFILFFFFSYLQKKL